jgi:enoyl-CoA hydratase
MTFETIRVERDGFVATVTIDRPAQLNALNSQVLSELLRAFQALRDDRAVRVVILTGAGEKAFIAGADIKEMADKTPLAGRAFADLGLAVLDAIESLPQPVLAAVGGFALGGGTEVALACDLVYASSKARFGQPEVNLGIIPGFGGTQRLARLVGRNLAKEIIFTGDLVDAQRAREIGLVSAVFEPAELLAKVRAVAEKIAAKGPLAIAAAKRAINAGVDLPLAGGLEIEKGAFAGLFGSHDQREGMRAFVEKRKAEFTGE